MKAATSRQVFVFSSGIWLPGLARYQVAAIQDDGQAAFPEPAGNGLDRLPISPVVAEKYVVAGRHRTGRRQVAATPELS